MVLSVVVSVLILMISFFSDIRIRFSIIIVIFLFAIYLVSRMQLMERKSGKQADACTWMINYICDPIPEGIVVGEVIDQGGIGSSRVAVIFSFNDNHHAETMIKFGNYEIMSSSNDIYVQRILNRYNLKFYEYTYYQKRSGASMNIIAINYNSGKGLFYYAPN